MSRSLEDILFGAPSPQARRVTQVASLIAAALLLAVEADPDIDPVGFLVSEKYDGVRAVWDGHTLRTRLPRLLTLGRADTAEQEHGFAETSNQLSGLLPTQGHRIGVSLGQLDRRQGDKVDAHLFSQAKLFGVVARSREPARRRQRTTGAGVLAQLRAGDVPAGGRKIPQPFERPLEHQLRLARTQAHGIHRQVAVFRVVAVGGAQLNQLDAARNGFLNATQQFRGFQALRRNQVFSRQSRGSDDRQIGGWKLVIAQLTRGHPGQWLAFGAMGLAGKCRNLPDIQQHLLVRIVMLDLDQGTRGAHHDPQLFVQFAGQRGLHRLALLDLASGKFPQTALVLVLRAPGDQDASIGTPNHRCCDMNALHPFTSCNAA